MKPSANSTTRRLPIKIPLGGRALKLIPNTNYFVKKKKKMDKSLDSGQNSNKIDQTLRYKDIIKINC